MTYDQLKKLVMKAYLDVDDFRIENVYLPDCQREALVDEMGALQLNIVDCQKALLPDWKKRGYILSATNIRKG